jgi:hypothetical protein
MMARKIVSNRLKLIVNDIFIGGLKNCREGLTQYGNWYKDSLDMDYNGVLTPDYTL